MISRKKVFKKHSSRLNLKRSTTKLNISFKEILDRIYRKGENDLQTKKNTWIKKVKLCIYEYNRFYLLLIDIFTIPDIISSPWSIRTIHWPIQPYNRNKRMYASITSNKFCKKDNFFFWIGNNSIKCSHSWSSKGDSLPVQSNNSIL